MKYHLPKVHLVSNSKCRIIIRLSFYWKILVVYLHNTYRLLLEFILMHESGLSEIDLLFILMHESGLSEMDLLFILMHESGLSEMDLLYFYSVP